MGSPLDNGMRGPRDNRGMIEILQAWWAAVSPWLASPQAGLSALFATAFFSATMIPMGSEAVLIALVRADHRQIWEAIAVATLGNTLGGVATWGMGRAASTAWQRMRHHPAHVRALQWLTRFGPRACLLAWLPIVGDPLCAAAGWMNLPLWPCARYMAIGRGLRYGVLTLAALWLMDGHWR